MSNKTAFNLHEKVIAIILAGGQGTRLHPLTLHRCKPAVSFGGRYRLIDVPISNSVNSKIRKIYVISQYFASGLQKHLSSTYKHESFSKGNLEMLCPEETTEGIAWFKGTADAVRQNFKHFKDPNAEYYLILSGDQLYNFDFLDMVEFAKKKNADLVIASLPVKQADAKRMGLLKIDDKSHIEDFFEKPQDPNVLDRFETDKGKYLGSMGIYVFKKKALEKLLGQKGDDFGKDLIPKMITQKNSYAYVYNGYWEDIGTVLSFYQANLALIDKKNCLIMDDPWRPIFGQKHHLGNTVIKNTQVDRSIISLGCSIKAKEILHSLIGARTRIGEGSVIRDSIVMGNPGVYEEEELRIGNNCQIERAIIDEHARIGSGVKLVNEKKLKHFDGDGVYIRDGIIIVTSGTVVPDNYII